MSHQFVLPFTNQMITIFCSPPLQAVNGELIPFLLDLLESTLSECEKPSATKALIAESLKNMARDLANGEAVRTHTHPHTHTHTHMPHHTTHPLTHLRTHTRVNCIASHSIWDSQTCACTVCIHVALLYVCYWPV